MHVGVPSAEPVEPIIGVRERPDETRCVFFRVLTNLRLRDGDGTQVSWSGREGGAHYGGRRGRRVRAAAERRQE